jgi:E3 ubiquitin-protein ligase SHPRH
MLEQSDLSIRADQRALLLSRLKRGQTLENGPEVKQALGIWTEVLEEASEVVLECRQQLQKEILATRGVGESNNVTRESSDDGSQDVVEEERYATDDTTLE